MAKKMISGFFAILIGYGIIVALLFLFQRNLIYFPPPTGLNRRITRCQR